jgi:glycosyltransferase involved in cell wall biosynthesis
MGGIKVKEPQPRTFTAAARKTGLQNSGERLLFVTPRYAPLIGGVETHVERVAGRLVEDGLDVNVLTTNPGHLQPEEERRGVKIYRVRAWPARGDLYLAPDIYRMIHSQKWDLVHVQSYHTLVAPLAMAAALQAGLPYVVTFHGGGHSSRFRNALRRGQHFTLRPLLKRAERLVAVAEFEIAYFASRLGISEDKFVLIPNGADLPSVPDAPLSGKNGTTIASVGRLERYKGHHRILAALPHILRRRPDTRLWIAGTGPYAGELRRQAEQLGVVEQVEIRAVPPGERERMARELSQVDLVVLLSEYETHPIAVIEALSLGRPVLVADTSGLGELSRKGWARAVPLNSSPEQVAEAVLLQLEQPLVPAELDLFTWEDCASQLLGLYRSIWEAAE